MPLQMSTTGVCQPFLRFPTQTIPACSAKVSCTNIPSFIMWFRHITKYEANPHSTKHDTQPIAFLISRQAVSYRTCGDTYCPRVSTLKILSLADSSTTCHDSINHLHNCIHSSNHNIHPHVAKSHLDGWKTKLSHKNTSHTNHHKG
jgi:hypothetical protein